MSDELVRDHLLSVRDRVDIAQAFLPLRRSHLKAAGTDGEPSARVAARASVAGSLERGRSPVAAPLLSSS